MKKILVLGSEGFIGQHLVTLAMKESFQVYGVDLVDKMPIKYEYRKISLLSSDLDLLLVETKFDIIINCAGSGNVAYSYQHSLTDFDLNTRSVVFILQAIRKHQPNTKYLHVSSAAVYGNPNKFPLNEIDPIKPISPYGYHKWMSEIICKEYADLYDLNIAIVRPFSVYGPGLQKQLIWDLFMKASLNEDLILWGTGEETRDFIFVEDLVRALLIIGQVDKSEMTIYNLASGQAVTIQHVALLLLKSLDWKRTIHFNNEVRAGDPRFWQADISLIKTLGFEPAISLTDGIKLTVAWLKSNKIN